MLRRWAHRAVRMSLCGLAATVVLAWNTRASTAASPQTTATDVCVIMTGSNGQVMGLQLDLGWDPACMTAQRGQGDAGQCASNPATGKNVQTKLFPNNSTLRALFLSISDTSPVPDDELFCCRFALANARSNPCCGVNIGHLILANPHVPGGRVYDPGISVQALVGNTPCTASAPGGSASIPVRPPLPSAVAPIAPAPVVSAPGAQPAPADAAPLPPTSRPQATPVTRQAPIGVGRLPAAAGPAAVPAGELPAAPGQVPEPESAVTPAEPVVQLTPTGAVRRTATPQRTPAATTPTLARSPQPQGTKTAAAIESVTPQPLTPTPPPRVKSRKRKTISRQAPAGQPTP